MVYRRVRRKYNQLYVFLIVKKKNQKTNFYVTISNVLLQVICIYILCALTDIRLHT